MLDHTCHHRVHIQAEHRLVFLICDHEASKPLKFVSPRFARFVAWTRNPGIRPALFFIPRLNTGVNDVEHLSPEEIINSQIEMVKAAIEVFPEKKIILSSITPRQDDHNDDIFHINEEIHKQIKELPNVIHVYNGNLQNSKYFYDHKHLNKKLGIPMLARNIKQCIREIFKHPQHNKENNQQRTKQQRTNPKETNHLKPNASTDIAPPKVPTPPQQSVEHNIQTQIEHLTGLLQSVIQTQALNHRYYPQVMYPNNVGPFLQPRYVNQAIRP